MTFYACFLACLDSPWLYAFIFLSVSLNQFHAYICFIFCGKKGAQRFSFCSNATWVANPIGSYAENKSILYFFFSISSPQSSTLDCECGVLDNTLQEEKERTMLLMASRIRSPRWYVQKIRHLLQFNLGSVYHLL